MNMQAAACAIVQKWLFALLISAILGGLPVGALADDPDRVRRIHDSSNRLIGTIERQSDGSGRVYDRNGRYLGAGDESGTHDATGHTVSPDMAPKILLPRGHVRESDRPDAGD